MQMLSQLQEEPIEAAGTFLDVIGTYLPSDAAQLSNELLQRSS